MWNHIDLFNKKDLNSTLSVLKQKQELLLSLNDVDSLRRLWKYRDANHLRESLAIEGTSITIEDAITIIEGGVPFLKSREVMLESINLGTAIEYMHNCVYDNVEFSEQLICDFHKILSANLLQPNNIGRYRQVRVYINQSNYMPAEINQVPKLMKRLVEVTNKETNPIVWATHFHYNLVSIHPFVDCNGRLARLCEAFLLIQGGYPPAVILEEERMKYINLLKQSSEKSRPQNTEYTRWICNKVNEQLDYFLYDNEINRF